MLMAHTPLLVLLCPLDTHNSGAPTQKLILRQSLGTYPVMLAMTSL